MTIFRKTIAVPELDHDAMMFAEFGNKVGPNGRLERRIVFALCEHLRAAGWMPDRVWDTEIYTEVSDAKAAMELIFNLDDAYLFFAKDGIQQWVRFVLGEGVDVICDYTCRIESFNAAMASFDPEEYA